MVEITSEIQTPSLKFLLDKMNVGDSFPVDNGTEKTVRHAVWRYFHKEVNGVPISERVFTVRRDPKDDKNFRCWRDK